jgi:hypothetical protein
MRRTPEEIEAHTAETGLSAEDVIVRSHHSSGLPPEERQPTDRIQCCAANVEGCVEDVLRRS